MNFISRIITGAIMIIIGLTLILTTFLVNFVSSFPLLFFGIPLLIIGFFIFFNKNEDKIELISERRIKKNG